MTSVLAKPKNYVALEIIDFQDNSFGMQLESEISVIVEAINNGVYKDSKEVVFCKELGIIEKDIFNRLGVNVKLIVNRELAAILPFYANKHHIFVNDFWKGNFSIKDQEKVLSTINNKKGYVDLKKAKLGGIFSEYKNSLYLNFYELVKTHKLTASEIVGVILHELGHAFYVCEFSDRLESTNQVLMNISKEITSGKKEKNLTYIYTELKTINDKITMEEVDKLVNGNKIVAGYLWYKTIIESAGIGYNSQQTNKKYDETAFEQLADNFSSRFGYGRQLISGLEKLHSVSSVYNRSITAVIFFEMIEVLLTTALIAVTFMTTVPLGMFFSVLVLAVFVFNGDEFKDLTYDELKDRYKRIRNEYVALLKDKDLDDKELKVIIDNVAIADKLINDMVNYKGVFTMLSNALVPVNRKANRAIAEQQLLEELAFNDLFIKSGELRLQA